MKSAVALATLELAKADGGGRRLGDERERKRLLEALDASGLTQRAFAAREGINCFTPAGWLRRRRQEAARAMASAAAKVPAFVEVKLPRAGMAVEIVLPDGLIVRACRIEDAVACVKGLR